ncbi:MAG TPA: MFS transporter, partial [Methylomirabilota bacterium]|nr:MFS transporter [Methylomirabilota bacterium]
LAEFGWERGVTAGAFSFGFVVSMLFTPLLGALMDRWGPRRVIPAGVTLVAAGLALGTLVRQPWHLYLTLGLLVAAGSVTVGYTGQSLYLPSWFARRRGMALGVAFSGVGIGSAIMFPWLQALIDRAGWRAGCWALAVVLLVVLVPLNAVLPRARPEELGLGPDGDPPGSAGKGGHAADVVDPAWAAVDWTLARALRTARFWWLGLGFFGALFAWYAVQVHQTKYLVEIGFHPTMAAWALGLVGLTGVAGQIALGHLSDRIGREWVWTAGNAGFVLSYAALLAMAQAPTPALLYAMVAAQGLLGYGLASIYGAIPAELFQGRHYGTIFGALGLASGFGAGLGPWLAGVLHDRTGSYAPGFWLAIAGSLVSIAAVWLAAPRKVRAVAGRLPAAR